MTAEQHLMQVPIRRLPHRYAVVIDPSMDRRGHCRKPVRMPSGDEIPGVIRLRTWDEEVFLHECIHALADELNLTDLIEEEVARQVSQGLYAMGWRLADPPVTFQREDQSGCDGLRYALSNEWTRNALNSIATALGVHIEGDYGAKSNSILLDDILGHIGRHLQEGE